MLAAAAIFFDRSGTLIEDPGGPVLDVEDIVWLPGAIEAIKLAQEKGFKVVILSNQPWVNRGMITAARLEETFEELQETIEKSGLLRIDKIYYCPHTPEENCDCRKPKTGLIERAVEELNIELEKSLIVGDRDKDLLLARNAGCKGYLVMTGHGKITLEKIKENPELADGIFDTPLDAVKDFIEKQ